MPQRRGIAIDPEWLNLEFDVRLLDLGEFMATTGFSRSTMSRLLNGTPVSRPTIRTLLNNLYTTPPIRALEDALPAPKRDLLLRRREGFTSYADKEYKR